jgi:lysozyme
MATLGADISKWQGDEIDWRKVAASPLRFVIMKATQGTRVDPEFLGNWRDCAHFAPHIVRGAYHLVELDDPIEPQVRAFLSAVPGEGWPAGCIPPCLDIETSKIDEIPDNPEEDLAKILEWCRRVEHAIGVTPLIYMSPRGVRHLKGHTEGLGCYGLWHVEYVKGKPSLPKKVPTEWSDWTFWQYTSSGDRDGDGVREAKAYGFESNRLDFNFFNGTRSDLLAFVRGTASTPAPVALDIAGALAYNASRGYTPELEGRVLAKVGAHLWSTDGVIKAIADWQRANGLKADGMIGPKTLDAMSF